EQAGYFRKTLGMARGEDHDRARMAGENILKGLKQQAFFILHGAAADQDGARAGVLKDSSQTGHDGRSRRQRNVELEIAADLNLGGRCADVDEAGAVLLGLSEKDVDVGEDCFQQPAKAAVSGPGAVRDTGVGDGNPSASSVSQTQEVGPELGFGDDDQLWLHGFEIGLDCKFKVEREIEDTFSAEKLAG